MARQRYPGGHRGTWQGGGFLEGQMAGHRHNRFLAQHRVFRQHPIEIGAEPVGQVVGLNRPAEPAQMKAAGNSVASSITPPFDVIRPPSKAALTFFRATAGRSKGRAISSAITVCRSSIGLCAASARGII
jgi:hypothetical protein